VRCVQGGDLLQITYDQLKQLYIQDPTFGFYFLQLATAGSFGNVERLEKEVVELRKR
jgi:hypothetical protein